MFLKYKVGTADFSAARDLVQRSIKLCSSAGDRKAVFTYMQDALLSELRLITSHYVASHHPMELITREVQVDRNIKSTRAVAANHVLHLISNLVASDYALQ